MATILRMGKEIHERLERERRRELRHAWVDNLVIESVYREADGDANALEPVMQEAKKLINRKAREFAREFNKYRLYYEDFLEVFQEKAILFARDFINADAGDKFLKQLSAALYHAGMSYVRYHLETDKRKAFHLADSLDATITGSDGEAFSLYDVVSAAEDTEKTAILRATIDMMAHDPSLTDQERSMFEHLRRDPDMTLQELADALGLRDRKQAHRVRERMAVKLRKYIEDDEGANKALF